MHIIDVDSVLSRLTAVLGVTKANQLAVALGVSPQAISSWKSRGSIPYAECVLVAQEHGVSLDWLLLGRGCMSAAAGADAFCTENDREALMLGLWRELSEDGKKTLQIAAEEKLRMKVLEHRIGELEAVVAGGKRLA